MKNYFLIFAALLFIISSCKTGERSTASIPKMNSKRLNQVVKRNHFDFKYFTNKARVNFNKQSFTANFRMEKDSLIWISLTGPFNIEGARVLITPNRFQMVDKLNRRYYDKPISFIENFIPVKADFAMIQNLILGNFLEDGIKKQKIETKEGTYIVKGNIPMLETLYFLNRNGKFQSIEIQETSANRNIIVSFDKYEKLDNQLFALKRKFEIKDNNKEYLLDLKFYKYSKEKTDFPFKKPNGYTEIN